MLPRQRVTYHNEDIHNIIKIPTPPLLKTPMYKSKRNKLRGTDGAGNNINKSGHQTLGLAHYEAPDSKNYLKKKTGHKTLTQPIYSVDKKKFACTLSASLPRIPKWKIDRPKSSSKNFVKENIKWVGSLEPKTPYPRCVDSPRGTVKDLKHLIEMIKIREREEYGKVPGYLCARKKNRELYLERKKRKDEIEKTYRQEMGIGNNGMGENLYMVNKETREKLLQGLKEHWNELSKQFLRLPVMCDTMTKIKRKIWLEKEIDRVEKDVKLVESHPFIYLERNDKRRTSEIAEDILREQERQKKEQDRKMNEDNKQDLTDEGKGDDKELTVHNYEKEKEIN